MRVRVGMRWRGRGRCGRGCDGGWEGIKGICGCEDNRILLSVPSLLMFNYLNCTTYTAPLLKTARPARQPAKASKPTHLKISPAVLHQPMCRPLC